MEREPGRRFRLDGPLAVVAGRDLDVDASVGVRVLDLGVGVEHASPVVDRELEILGYSVPFGIGGPPTDLRPRCLAPARDGALELHGHGLF